MRAYSRGMGAMGLPGDLSSSSRFVRACFANANVEEASGREAGVNRMFHVMQTVMQPRGFARTETGLPIESVYAACIALEEPAYFVSTYACRQLFAVRMPPKKEGAALLRYSIAQLKEDVTWLI